MGVLMYSSINTIIGVPTNILKFGYDGSKTRRMRWEVANLIKKPYPYHIFKEDKRSSKHSQYSSTTKFFFSSMQSKLFNKKQNKLYLKKFFFNF